MKGIILFSFITTILIGIQVVRAQQTVFQGNEQLLYEVRYESELKKFTDTIVIALTPISMNNSEELERVMIYQFNASNNNSRLDYNSSRVADSSSYSDQDKAFYMNPPLYRYYNILELAPTPRVEFPLFPNKAYGHKTYLSAEWGSWSGSKVSSTYRVIHNTSTTWRIEAEAIISADESFSNKLYILFNSKEGFLELYYEFADGTTVELNKI